MMKIDLQANYSGVFVSDLVQSHNDLVAALEAQRNEAQTAAAKAVAVATGSARETGYMRTALESLASQLDTAQKELAAVKEAAGSQSKD